MKAGEADRANGATSSGRAYAALTTLGRRIATGTYEVGATLPVEADLASELGVSRSTIREAVRSLVTLGLLEVRTRAGTRVRPKQAWNVLNQNVLGWMTSADSEDRELIQAIDEAREIFEPHAAALAARRASRSDVAAISRGYEGMAVAVEADDAQAAIMADREFHHAILMATDNPILMAFDTAIDAVLGILFQVAAAEHWEVFRANLENHRRVLEAIRDGNSEDASQAMRETIGFTRRSLEKHVFSN